MQIIVISDRLAKARTLTVTARHVIATGFLGIVALTGLTIGMYAFTLRFAAEVELPYLHDIVLTAQRGESLKAREFVRQNLNAMAVKLGEMQAQLTRLDALGERLSTLAGIMPQEFRFKELPGLGGAQSNQFSPRDLSMQEFNDRVSMLARQMENRNDLLGVLEAQMFEKAVRKKLLPTMLPVNASYSSSSFGMRIDPFTGQNTMHEGIDFIVEKGTPIVAAAGGVVQFAGAHPQYGYVVDIDHGNDLMTRYAHCSKLLVKTGDFVQRGHQIALSGATGRATGSHLHFEVRYRGSAQNPARFLYAANPPTTLARARR